MDIKHIDDSILRSYRELRMWVGILAFLFPLLLLGWGKIWGIDVQPTLSNYYFAVDTHGRVDTFPVRLWFCGILFIVGFFLHKYHGFSKNEDRWLSVAGVFALGVAIFPMTTDKGNEYDFLLAWSGLTKFVSVHGICAVVAFGAIAIVIVHYADATLSELKPTQPARYVFFRRIYILIAAFMVGTIGISIYLNMVHPGRYDILVAEWAGLWSFAAYWFVKNWELSEVSKVLGARKPPRGPKTKADLADRL